MDPLMLVQRAPTDSSTTRITFGGRRAAPKRVAGGPVAICRSMADADGVRRPIGSKSARSALGNVSVIRTVPFAIHHDEMSIQCGFAAICRPCRLAQSAPNAY